MARKRVNEVEPGTSFSNPIWHKGFRIYPYTNSKMPHVSYAFEADAHMEFTATIAGAKTKIDHLLGDAKP